MLQEVPVSQSVLLKLARESIQEVLEAQNTIDRDVLLEQYPVLGQKMATFVTLTIGGELRGCIGSLVAQRPLIDDIIHNAKAAAFQDPRFTPVTTSEYLHCMVEISLLTAPEEVEYSDIADLKTKIRPGIDGVILSLGNQQATFLPQVWEQLPEFEQFFAHLGLKAGIGTDALNHHPQIFTYQVEKAHDEPIIRTPNEQKPV
jgi:AmmeMemoRadiSam system protein A